MREKIHTRAFWKISTGSKHLSGTLSIYIYMGYYEISMGINRIYPGLVFGKFDMLFLLVSMMFLSIHLRQYKLWFTVTGYPLGVGVAMATLVN